MQEDTVDERGFLSFLTRLGSSRDPPGSLLVTPRDVSSSVTRGAGDHSRKEKTATAAGRVHESRPRRKD